MASLWPWLAVAGMGALHGLNPATGWLLAAAWGVRARDRGQALRALLPIGVGHVASIALVAGAVALGVSMDRDVLAAAVGGLLVVAASVHLWRRAATSVRAPAGHAALALWSFMMTTAHGAGLMLVPALIPICMGDASARQITASSSLLLALAAVALHGAAMLAVTGGVASGVCRGVGAVRRSAGKAGRAERYGPSVATSHAGCGHSSSSATRRTTQATSAAANAAGSARSPS
jgi:hypothetical protein